MQKVLAWHGDPALKAEALALMTRHRERDEILQGAYVQRNPFATSGFKGCFHGCLTAEKVAKERGVRAWELDDLGSTLWVHGERIWGIPKQIGCALDTAFERMNHLNATWFAVAAIEAIPVGADLYMISERLREEVQYVDALSPRDELQLLLDILASAPVPEPVPTVDYAAAAIEAEQVDFDQLEPVEVEIELPEHIGRIVDEFLANPQVGPVLVRGGRRG